MLLFKDVVWDDEEEKRYRDWVHQQDLRRDSTTAEWTEQEAEAAYRANIKAQQAENADVAVDWHDESEREFRRRYLEMR